MKAKIISLTSNEIWPLLNVLNEVCNGISIENFEERMGSKKEDVISLMNRIAEEEQKEESLISLSKIDIEILKKSFELLFKYIDEWEFETRVGISVEDANSLKNKLVG